MKSFHNFEGLYWGYARVSTEEQNLDMQMDALKAFGIPERRIHTDKASGRSMERTGLRRVRLSMRPGDCLVVWKLDRLGRSALGLAQTIKEFDDKGMHFKALDWDIDTTVPFGKMVFTIMAAIAELESDLISARTKEGIRAAKARGKEFGKRHYILSYPKRHKRFIELWVEGKIHHEGEMMDYHLSAQEVIDEMHRADKKAPKYTTITSYRNWKTRGYSGFDIEAANALQRRDVSGD